MERCRVKVGEKRKKEKKSAEIYCYFVYKCNETKCIQKMCTKCNEISDLLKIELFVLFCWIHS